MYKHITRLTVDDVAARPQILTDQQEFDALSSSAGLALATIAAPLAVLGLALAFTRDTNLAGALCFFTYAQLAHYLAARRSRRRKLGLIELFRMDQARSQPAVAPEKLTDALAAFSRPHRLATLAEMVGAPVGAMVLAAFEASQMVTNDAPALRPFVYFAPVVLVGSLVVLLTSLKKLDRMQVATFATKIESTL